MCCQADELRNRRCCQGIVGFSSEGEGPKGLQRSVSPAQFSCPSLGSSCDGVGQFRHFSHSDFATNTPSQALSTEILVNSQHQGLDNSLFSRSKSRVWNQRRKQICPRRAQFSTSPTGAHQRPPWSSGSLSASSPKLMSGRSQMRGCLGRTVGTFWGFRFSNHSSALYRFIYC